MAPDKLGGRTVIYVHVCFECIPCVYMVSVHCERTLCVVRGVCALCACVACMVCLVCAKYVTVV